MDDTRLMDWLIALHAGLPRLGPGSETATRRALADCVGLPADPEILDIGCGSGAASLVLAESTTGHITAVDRVPLFLLDLRTRAQARGLDGRIRPLVADMHALPFRSDAFDLIWSEGAIYIMGFDAGLTHWRSLLRPGGWLVVSELSWFTDHPPAALRDHWREDYPGMRNVADNLAAARALGWATVGHFPLPTEAWTIDYYGPLQARLPGFRAAHADDPEALAVADMTEQEIALMTDAAGICGYVFYILRRIG
ncbi:MULTISPECIES: class I SAM-dependent methyltransferase [unclassified Thiocapsa]|uniref:class I SAM-dependent methyltransferase n=1 Tax=unclassified Thiocapsa TaxID=2641286 RepID=UPI0035AFF51B